MPRLDMLTDTVPDQAGMNSPNRSRLRLVREDGSARAGGRPNGIAAGRKLIAPTGMSMFRLELREQVDGTGRTPGGDRR